MTHALHGRGTAEGGPDDPACGCTGTSKQTQCADAGCGFCVAAEQRPATPLADEAEAHLSDIRRNGDTLEAIQKAINNRGKPQDYTATLEHIEQLMYDWRQARGQR